jgi:hypothetical protein
LFSTILRASITAGAGLGAFLIGLLLIFLPFTPSVSPQIIGEALLPSMANLESLLKGFGVDAPGTYLYSDQYLGGLRVFVPLSETSSIVPVEAQTAASILIMPESDPAKGGLLLQPPGAGLLTMIERETEQDMTTIGLSDLEGALESTMVSGLGLASNIRLSPENSTVQFTVGGDALWVFTERMVREMPLVCERVGCPICSLMACAVSKSAHSKVRFAGSSHQNGKHSGSLQLVE